MGATIASHAWMSGVHSFVAFVCGVGLVSGVRAAHEVQLQDMPSETFAGHATADATGTWFTPCVTAPDAAKWWITLTGASVQQAERAKGSHCILEVRTPGPDDCRGTAP